jgi:hypothetical protein
MGNMIVMAVRHRDLDEVAKLKYSEIDGMIHRSDGLPKTFDGNELWLSATDRHFSGDHPNVVMSQYYHSSGTTMLYIDDQMMVAAHPLEWTVAKGEALVFDKALPRIKKRLKEQKLSILDRKGTVDRPAVSGDKVSLFAIFTDCCDSLEKNPHTMEDVVHFCRTGESLTRTMGSYNRGMKALGTLEADQAVLLQVAEYQGHMNIVPRREVNIHQDEWDQIIAHYGEKEWRKGILTYEAALLRELSAANGYLVRPTVSRKAS